MRNRGARGMVGGSDTATVLEVQKLWPYYRADIVISASLRTIKNMSQRPKNRDKRGKATKIFAGRYAYRKPLGRGAGGSVYLAEDLRRDYREVALKVLSAEACETVQGKMLRREFEILSKLDHPNLVRVYDYGSLPDGGVFLAEEYIDGFSLQDARALLEPEALIDPTLQILQGLSYLHAMGMIHRDIKPANVMMLWLDDASARPMIKLVDFGLSSMNPKRDTLRGGTRSYMAPEIIRGEKAETRSDLYSLGVTLYYALCGVLPFGPRSKKDPPPTEEDFRPPDPHRLNEDVPLELSRFTMALLRQVPDIDYADAGEALQALAADSGALEKRSVGQMANSLDVSAAPVIRGYFERGILSRRIDEDDLLLEWLSMAEDQGKGQMYLVRGNRGVGKSRLLHDVQASSKLSGHLVLSLKCEDGDGPYAVLTKMVERLVEVAQSHGVLAVEKYDVPLCIQRALTLIGAGDDASGAELVDAGWLRQALEDTVGILVNQKVVYFIDDIDRADAESREVLYEWYGAADGDPRPAIVATTRRGEFYRRFSRQKGVQVLPIEGVGKGDVEAFLCEQLGISGLSLSWIEAVAKASQGRPAYIEELCRFLIDGGMLWRDSVRQWKARVDDIEAAGVPTSLRESLRRRITAVGASGRECLELLALIGRPLSWRSARRLLERGGSSSEEAEQTLRTVQWRHLVKMDLTPEGRYLRVVHRELAEAVIDMLSPEWARALHRRIGEELARDWQHGRGDALEAATHLRDGGHHERSAAFYEIAADHALWRGGDSAGADLYKLALDGAVGIEDRALLHGKLARARLAGFDPESCQESLERAIELAEESEREWLIYRVGIDAAYGAYAMGKIDDARQCVDRLCTSMPQLAQGVEVVVFGAILDASAGKIDEALQALKQCLATTGGALIPQRRVEILTSMARLDAVQGRSEKAMQTFERAEQLAGTRGDPVAKGTVLLYHGTELRRMEKPVEAQKLLSNSLLLLAGSDAPHHFIEVLFQLSWVLADLGSSTQSRRRAQQAMYFANRLGHPGYREKVAILLGSLMLSNREVKAGLVEQIESTVKAFERREDFVVDRAEILMSLGDLMITLQLKELGPALLQRGRQVAYECGATGLLPPVEE